MLLFVFVYERAIVDETKTIEVTLNIKEERKH